MFTIYKRELKSYFTQPTAYAVICIFTFLALFFSIFFGGFLERGDANLAWSFFFWHPWILMLLAPALGMHIWAEEQRTGTIELLGTFPTTTWSAIVGKFAAAATVWLIALAMTCPIVIAVNTLGDPDNLTIFSGYIGSFLICCTFLAITCLVSAFTRNQVVCLIVSVTICKTLVTIGYEQVAMKIRQTFSQPVAEAILSITAFEHFKPMIQGVIHIENLVYFFSIIIACLLCTSAILNSKRS
ncbi:MAG: ABC transporter permease [Akkermansiaceae bacterium]